MDLLITVDERDGYIRITQLECVELDENIKDKYFAIIDTSKCFIVDENMNISNKKYYVYKVDNKNNERIERVIILHNFNQSLRKKYLDLSKVQCSIMSIDTFIRNVENRIDENINFYANFELKDYIKKRKITMKQFKNLLERYKKDSFKIINELGKISKKLYDNLVKNFEKEYEFYKNNIDNVIKELEKYNNILEIRNNAGYVYVTLSNYKSIEIGFTGIDNDFKIIF